MPPETLSDMTTVNIEPGTYTFKVLEIIEKRNHTDKRGKPYYTNKLKFLATDQEGDSCTHVDSFLSFEPRYRTLLVVLGADLDDKGRPVGSTCRPVGKSFTADIVMEQDSRPDMKDKYWPRITNIQIEPGLVADEETPPPDDDIPWD